MITHTITLTDGGLISLANGSKMSAISSIVEYVDNAISAKASEIRIKIDNERHILSVASIEETDLMPSDIGKMFEYSKGKSLQTSTYGVNKYGVGIKQAAAYLIGEKNKGEARYVIRPRKGNCTKPIWGVTHIIDYTNPDKYTDLVVKEMDDLSDEGYDFVVKVIGCIKIPESDIIKLRVSLGLRYRALIEKGETKIFVNDAKIAPQDRLYSIYGDEVMYTVQNFNIGNVENAITLEMCDLRCRKTFNETEYIDYDSKGYVKSVGPISTERSLGEIALGNISIIYEGQLKNLLGINPQPSSSGFRFRLTFNDRSLGDKYIKGANKSNCSIDKSFVNDEALRPVRDALNEFYNTAINRFKQEPVARTGKSMKVPNEYCKDKELPYRFYLDGLGETNITFEERGNDIWINHDSKLFKGLKIDGINKIIMALLFTKEKKTTKKAIAFLREYEKLL